MKSKVSVKTKYDCPYYIFRGGHCKIQSYSTSRSVHMFGCNYQRDISKCPFTKGKDKQSILV